MRVLVVCPDPAIDAYVWLDALIPGGVNRAIHEERFPGGKGIHVAMALRELGAEVRLLGLWLGPTGTWIREQCLLRGIDVAGPVTGGFARTCLTFRGPPGVEFTELRGRSEMPERDAAEQLLAAFEQDAGQVDAVVISGGWASGRGPESCAHLVARARQLGVPVGVDCDGDTLRSALGQRPDMVHLNSHEAEALTGSSDNALTARQLAAHGSVVAVSAGADGVFVAGGSRLVHAASPVGHVIASVGAGDCLMAGMVWGSLNGGGDVKAVAKWAVACGAACCLSPDLGMLRRADVDWQLFRSTVSLVEGVEPRPAE